MKMQTLNSIFAATIIGLSLKVRANQVTGVVSIDGGKKALTYTVDTRSGDYELKLPAVINPQFVISRSEYKQWNCGALDKLINSSSPLHKYQYIVGPQPVYFRVANYNLSAVESEIGRQLAQDGYSVPKLKNKTIVVINPINVKFVWNNSSDTVRSGAESMNIAEQHLRALLNQPIVEYSLASAKGVRLDVEHLPLLCDLAQKKVQLDLTLHGGQYAELRQWTSITPSQVKLADDTLLKLDLSMREDKTSGYTTSFSNRSVVIPVLLGISIAKAHLDTQIRTADDIQSIASAMINQNYNPVQMTLESVNALIKSLSQPNGNLKQFNVTESVKVEVE